MISRNLLVWSPCYRLARRLVKLVQCLSCESVGDLMTARAAAIEKQARKLPAIERDRLAERLLAEVLQLTAVDQAWIDEAEKRFSAWKQRKTKPLGARRALNQIRRDILR